MCVFKSLSSTVLLEFLSLKLESLVSILNFLHSFYTIHCLSSSLFTSRLFIHNTLISFSMGRNDHGAAAGFRPLVGRRARRRLVAEPLYSCRWGGATGRGARAARGWGWGALGRLGICEIGNGRWN